MEPTRDEENPHMELSVPAGTGGPSEAPASSEADPPETTVEMPDRVQERRQITPPPPPTTSAARPPRAAPAPNADRRADAGGADGRGADGNEPQPTAPDADPDARPNPEFENFEFENFEQSEAELVQDDGNAATPASPPPTPAPQRRAVVRRTWLPTNHCHVETRPVGSMTVLSLRGRINESFRGADIGRTLRGPVVIDLSQVDRISSFGMKGWLQMMDQAQFSPCYLFRCSDSIVHQITMMRNFCGLAKIHSLLVPYQCDSCGEEFNPVYEAVRDRDLLIGRSAVPVECPHCNAASHVIDHTFSYMRLDDHLLERVPPELQDVVDHLEQPARTDAVEKFVTDRETRIRFHAPFDGRPRLTRALAGVEGRVVLDLTPRPEAGREAAERLIEAIRALGDEVTEVWIDGASRVLVELLLAQPIDRTYVSTAFVTLSGPNDKLRPALVDMRRNRPALLRAEMPEPEGGVRGTIVPDDLEVLLAATRQLVPAQKYRSTTTTMTPEQAESRVMTPPIRAVTRTTTPPPAGGGWRGSTRYSPVPPGPGRWSIPWWQVALLAAATIATATLTFVIVVALVARSGGGASSADGAGAALWDNGELLPPAWAEEGPVTVDPDGVHGVGFGVAPTMEEAAVRSREVAVYHIVQLIGRKVTAGPAGAAVGTDPGERQAGGVANRFLEDLGATVAIVRVERAIKAAPEGATVASRYELDNAGVQRAVDYYGKTVSFRGLTVGRAFPFQTDPNRSRAVVVAVASWFADRAAPGDVVVQVENTPIHTLEEFEQVAAATYKGGTDEYMRVLVDRDGKRSRLEFGRQNKPAVPDLLPQPEITP